MSKRSIAKGIAVRDTILWVEDTGDNDLPPVLCLHSLFLDGTMFDGFVEQANGRFRLIRPDFRGQGSSAPAAGDIVTMDDCATDMLALIETMKLPPVNLVGASMGGDVAVRMVARRPDLFRSLVMMGSSARGEPADQRERFRGLLNETAASGFVGAYLDILMSIMFGATTRAKPEARVLLDRWRTKMSLLPRSTWPAMFGVLERPSAVALLPKVTLPTLLFSGTDDIARPPDWGQEVADGVKGATFTILDGVGHSPILEVPEIVIPRILAFLAAAESPH
jgi:3-oxoadipate enol-lactonase